ncbi:hypothetical protein GBA52_017970 [Prunus armeniaca]|nr:hypothetical protein GBA52_017970 [Prunus armeniaca]
MEGALSSSTTYKEKENQENVEDHEILKNRISTHPLYGLLVEAHLDCLKVGGISGDLDLEGDVSRDMKQLDNKYKASENRQSDLDHFMEAYCLALGKLKEAMEEPQQTSMAFISNMHLQLKELTGSHQPEPATSLSGQSVDHLN